MADASGARTRGKVAEIVSIRENTVPSSLAGSTAAKPDLEDVFDVVFDLCPPPDQNPLEAGKRVEASGEIEEPGLGGDGQEAKVGGPRDGGEGGDRHARHLQLPRKQWEHQELAPVVEQPEVGLGSEMDLLSGDQIEKP